MANALARATVEIAPDMGGFAGKLQAGLSTAFGSTLSSVGNQLTAVGKKLFAKFTVPLAIATAANIAQFQALDREIRTTMTLLGTVPQLSDEVFGRMRDGITGVSQEVGGLEKDIADGLYQAISAGIPKDNVFEFLDVAQMAAMADKTSDLTTSVDAITTMMSSFSAQGLEAAEASDILFATVAKGKTTFGELGQSIGRAAGAAANAGVSAEEFSATIGTLTLSGLATSEAVSYLRASITGLLRPSEDMNAIFQDLGFASAEAAIPIIGLQPAFEAVVNAAGGSSSKLMELVGSAEAVSAILGVTGDNAGKFESVLLGTQNAAGSTARAYEMMEQSVGRSFGRMTEAFDRLGNLMGEFGSKFVVPVVNVITDVVNNMYGIFKAFAPIVSLVAGAFATLMKVFDIPGVKQTVAVFAALAVTITGMLGGVGALALAFGHLFITTSKLSAVAKLIPWFQKLGGSIIEMYPRVADTFANVGQQMGRIPIVGGKIEKSIGGVGKTMTDTATKAKAAMLGTIGVMAAVALAVGAATVAWQAYKKHLEAVKDEALVTVRGVDRLADSLGIVLSDTTDLGAYGQEVDISIKPKFVLENQALLKNLASIKDTLGDAGVKDYILGIAFNLKKGGASPEEITAAIIKLQQASGVTFSFDVEALGFDQLIGQLETTIALLDRVKTEDPTWWQTLFSGKETRDDGSYEVVSQNFKNQAAEAADEVANIFDVDPRRFEEAMGMLMDDDLTWGQENFLADEVLNSIADLTPEVTLGFKTIGAETTLEDALSQISGIAGYDEMMEIPARTRSFAAMDEAIRGTSTAISDLTEEEKAALETQKNLIGGIAGVFENASAHVDGVFNKIDERIMSQLPLLGIYSGAVVQTFEDWKASQELFQTDLALVTDMNTRIQEMPNISQAVKDDIASQSISSQAWLAMLSPEQFSEALSIMETSASEGHGSAATQAATRLGVTLDETAKMLTDAFDAMKLDADAAGPVVAENFQSALDVAGGQWVESTKGYMTQLQGVISGTIGGTPSITGPGFQTDVDVTNDNRQYNYYSTTTRTTNTRYQYGSGRW